MADFKLAGIVSAVGFGLGYLLSGRASQVMEAVQGEYGITYMEAHNDAKNQHKYYLLLTSGRDNYTAYGRLPGYGRDATMKLDKQPSASKMKELAMKKMKTYQLVGHKYDQIPSEIRAKLETAIGVKPSSPPAESKPQKEEPKKPMNARLAMAMKRKQMMGAEGTFEAEKEGLYFVFADGTTMRELEDYDNAIFLQWKIPYSQIRDYVNEWTDVLKKDQEWRLGDSPYHVAYDFAHSKSAPDIFTEPFGEEFPTMMQSWFGKEIEDAVKSRIWMLSDNYNDTVDLEEPMTKAEIRSFLTGITSWRKEIAKRAETFEAEDNTFNWGDTGLEEHFGFVQFIPKRNKQMPTHLYYMDNPAVFETNPPKKTMCGIYFKGKNVDFNVGWPNHLPLHPKHKSGGCEKCYEIMSNMLNKKSAESFEAEGVLCSDCPMAGRHVVIRKDHTDEEGNLICPFCHSNKNFKNIPETTYLLHGGRREDLRAEGGMSFDEKIKHLASYYGVGGLHIKRNYRKGQKLGEMMDDLGIPRGMVQEGRIKDEAIHQNKYKYLGVAAWDSNEKMVKAVIEQLRKEGKIISTRCAVCKDPFPPMFLFKKIAPKTGEEITVCKGCKGFFGAEYQPDQEIADYSVSEIAKSSAIEGYQPNKYSFGPIGYGAEMKLKKDSCCCGATKKHPCLCMIKGVKQCSAKSPMCPCYKEIAMGTKVEMEHTKSKEEAEKIAKEHLAEHPDYYSRLKSAGLDAESSDSIPKPNPVDKEETFAWVKREHPHIKTEADKEMDEYNYAALTYHPEELESGAVNALKAGDLEAAQNFVKAINRQKFIKAFQAEGDMEEFPLLYSTHNVNTAYCISHGTHYNYGLCEKMGRYGNYRGSEGYAGVGKPTCTHCLRKWKSMTENERKKFRDEFANY